MTVSLLNPVVLLRMLDSWFCVSFTFDRVSVTTTDAATVVVSVAVDVLWPMVDVLCP